MMKLSDVPAGSKFLDVASIPVVKLPNGKYITFDSPDLSRPYPDSRKADLEGDRLTRHEFREWIATGLNRFHR